VRQFEEQAHDVRFWDLKLSAFQPENPHF
jgi:hypothetical protein